MRTTHVVHLSPVSGKIRPVSSPSVKKVNHRSIQTSTIKLSEKTKPPVLRAGMRIG